MIFIGVFMEKLKIKAEGEKCQAAYNIYNFACPKQAKCNQVFDDTAIIVLSLIFSVAAWILGIFANLLTGHKAVESIALGAVGIMFWVLGLALMLLLHVKRLHKE